MRGNRNYQITYILIRPSLRLREPKQATSVLFFGHVILFVHHLPKASCPSKMIYIQSTQLRKKSVTEAALDKRHHLQQADPCVVHGPVGHEFEAILQHAGAKIRLFHLDLKARLLPISRSCIRELVCLDNAPQCIHGAVAYVSRNTPLSLGGCHGARTESQCQDCAAG